MRNLPLDAARCRGADDKFNPTICPQRDVCQRHVQLTLDRQLCLPPEVTEARKIMLFPRVGANECNYFAPL